MTVLLLVSCFSYAKRSEPEVVSPVIYGNYVYTAPHFISESGLVHNGGYVEVLDAKTGVPVWGIQVYQAAYDPSLERDVQSVFISSIEMNFWGSALTVTDEIGRKYVVNLKSKEVKKVE